MYARHGHGFEDMTADKEASLRGESGLVLTEVEPQDWPVSWVVRDEPRKASRLGGQADSLQPRSWVECEAFPPVSSSCANHNAAVTVMGTDPGVPSPQGKELLGYGKIKGYLTQMLQGSLPKSAHLQCMSWLLL